VASRNKKIEIFKNFLEPICTDEESLRSIVKLSIGVFQPKYNDDFNTNFAEALIIQSLSQTYRIDSKAVKKLLREIGDFGSVAVALHKDN
jgi:hypothetical protein